MQNEETKIRKIRAISRFSSVSNTGSGLREAHTAGVEIWRRSNKLVATMYMLKNRREMPAVGEKGYRFEQKAIKTKSRFLGERHKRILRASNKGDSRVNKKTRTQKYPLDDVTRCKGELFFVALHETQPKFAAETRSNRGSVCLEMFRTTRFRD